MQHCEGPPKISAEQFNLSKVKLPRILVSLRVHPQFHDQRPALVTLLQSQFWTKTVLLALH
jgi:hypothetical protein